MFIMKYYGYVNVLLVQKSAKSSFTIKSFIMSDGLSEFAMSGCTFLDAWLNGYSYEIEKQS